MKAAHQICMAQEHEVSGEYQSAFTQYKAGVETLLMGVQGNQIYLIVETHRYLLDILMITLLYIILFVDMCTVFMQVGTVS